MDQETSRSTTVAFELAALEALQHPAAAFVQTAGWARSVGIVSDRPTYVATKRAREWGVDYEFTSGPRDLLDSLVSIRAQPEHKAERYLLIATDSVASDSVRERGWALLTIEEAADAGGWPVIGSTQNDDRGWP